MNDLIDRAKAAGMKQGESTVPDPELAGLAIAYGLGEITLTQAGAALDVRGNSMYASLCRGFRDAFALGLLVRPASQKKGRG